MEGTEQEELLYHHQDITSGYFNIDKSTFKIRGFELQIRHCLETHLLEYVSKWDTSYSFIKTEIDNFVKAITANSGVQPRGRSYSRKFLPIYMFATLDRINSINGNTVYGIGRINGTHIASDIICKENSENIIYIGKMGSSRVNDGHYALQNLTAPKNEGKEKRIYLMQVRLNFENKGQLFENIPLEFLTPYDAIKDIINFIESLLIYNLQTKINTQYRNGICKTYNWFGNHLNLIPKRDGVYIVDNQESKLYVPQFITSGTVGTQIIQPRNMQTNTVP